ncbi:hypothetical protein ACOME3_005521 [Neoechinorhynchus agilis]
MASSSCIRRASLFAVRRISVRNRRRTLLPSTTLSREASTTFEERHVQNAIRRRQAHLQKIADMKGKPFWQANKPTAILFYSAMAAVTAEVFYAIYLVYQNI